MRFVLNALRPTPLGILLFVLGLLIQTALISVSSATFSFESHVPESSDWSFGPGAPVKIRVEGGAVSVDIRWGVLAFDLLATYLAAVAVARVLARATALRRPARAYGLVVAGALALAFLASVGLSKMYWGYWFARPPVPREVGDIARVVSVTPVTVSDGASAPAVTVRGDASLTKDLASARHDAYYGLDERVLLELERRNLLPPAYATSMPDLPDPLALVRDTGLLVQPGEGYEKEAGLRGGVIVDACDRAGGRLVVMGLVGGQVENDHYPYYELVFAGSPGSTGLAYVGGQRFFHDFAGIEGAEWYLVWPVLFLPAVVLGIPLFTLVRILAMHIRRRREPETPGRPVP